MLIDSQENNLHILFEAPDPRRIASLPVAWIASTIADGAAGGAAQSVYTHISGKQFALPVPLTDTSWSFRLPSTFLIPPSLYKESETALIQPSHDSGTAKRVCFQDVSLVYLMW